MAASSCSLTGRSGSFSLQAILCKTAVATTTACVVSSFYGRPIASAGKLRFRTKQRMKFYFKFNGQHFIFLTARFFCFNKKYSYKKYETRVLYLIFNFLRYVLVYYTMCMLMFNELFFLHIYFRLKLNTEYTYFVTIRLLNSRTVSVKILNFLWSVPMVTYLFSCLYTKSSYKNVNNKSVVILMELIPLFPNNN
jgi:hypothetical protein